jgi:hypothetical protein
MIFLELAVLLSSASIIVITIVAHHLKGHRSDNLSVYLSIYLYICGSTALCWTLAPFQFFDLLHGQYDSLDGGSARRKSSLPAHTGEHKHRINAYWHPYVKWGSNPRSQCLSGLQQFMLQTSRPLWSAGLITMATNISITELTGLLKTGAVGSCSIIRIYIAYSLFLSLNPCIAVCKHVSPFQTADILWLTPFA